MKEKSKIMFSTVIVIGIIVILYMIVLQLPKSYISEKYSIERAEIKSIYFIPPYVYDNSGHSSNIFDFEKVNPRWKYKYKNECFYVDYIDGKYYDDFQLTQLYNWSVEYLRENIDNNITGIELYCEDIYGFQIYIQDSSSCIQKSQVYDFLDYVLKNYEHDFVIYYLTNDVSHLINNLEDSELIKNDLQNKVCSHFNFGRKTAIYILDDNNIIEKICVDNRDLREGYFIEYEQRELLKQTRHLV